MNNFFEANDYFLQKENLFKKFCFLQKIKAIIFDFDFTFFYTSDIIVDNIRLDLKSQKYYSNSCEKFNTDKFLRKEVYEKTKFKFHRKEVIKLEKLLASDIISNNIFIICIDIRDDKNDYFCTFFYCKEIFSID
jgi:hypothetical protein